MKLPCIRCSQTHQLPGKGCALRLFLQGGAGPREPDGDSLGLRSRAWRPGLRWPDGTQGVDLPSGPNSWKAGQKTVTEVFRRQAVRASNPWRPDTKGPTGARGGVQGAQGRPLKKLCPHPDLQNL